MRQTLVDYDDEFGGDWWYALQRDFFELTQQRNKLRSKLLTMETPRAKVVPTGRHRDTDRRPR